MSLSEKKDEDAKDGLLAPCSWRVWGWRAPAPERERERGGKERKTKTKGATWTPFDAWTSARIEQALEYGLEHLPLKMTQNGVPKLVSVELKKKAVVLLRSKESKCLSDHSALEESVVEEFWSRQEVEQPSLEYQVRSSLTNLSLFGKVPRSDKEYQRVAREFQSTCGAPIIGIYRVNTDHFVETFKGVETRFLKNFNGQRDLLRETWLWFYVTSYPTLQRIQREGFNRDVNSISTPHGRGICFATSARDSVQMLESDPSFSSSALNQKGDQDNVHRLLFCRVLVGDYHVGSPSESCPALKSPGSRAVYNSRVNRLAGPTLFLLNEDFQALPEFLVEF